MSRPVDRPHLPPTTRTSPNAGGFSISLGRLLAVKAGWLVASVSGVGALITLASCAASSQPANSSSANMPRHVANSAAAAAKSYVLAFMHDDLAVMNHLTCSHGWTGSHGINVSVPAGRYVLDTTVRSTGGDWTVTVMATRNGRSTGVSAPFRVVHQGNGYLVCGINS
jgi:hypothetical protein